MSDFDRQIYCLAGLPFDALDMNKAISAVRNAKYHGMSCFLSTPNMNFVANAVDDPEFLKSVIYSDLVVADGTPIIWMAKLLGVPIKHRVAGSNLFEMLKEEKRRTMKVYFMGGLEGVAEAASKEMNSSEGGLKCVGYYNPGFGTIDEMSTDEIIDNINASEADFLVVALGAKKGQAWIMHNLDRIKVPLVSHLGAVINFEAKRVQRAPTILQNTGFEWLWRIKEEPELWRRYFKDGLFFLNMLATKVLPLRFWLKRHLKRLKSLKDKSWVNVANAGTNNTIRVNGAIFDDDISPEVRDLFRQLGKENKSVDIDLSDAEYVSAGFFGLILMLKKQLDHKGVETRIVNCNASIAKVVDWTGLSYMLA